MDEKALFAIAMVLLDRLGGSASIAVAELEHAESWELRSWPSTSFMSDATMLELRKAPIDSAAETPAAGTAYHLASDITLAPNGAGGVDVLIEGRPFPYFFEEAVPRAPGASPLPAVTLTVWAERVQLLDKRPEG